MLENLKKIGSLFLTIRSSKLLSLLVIFGIAAVVPLTVLVAQMNQDTRQRASEEEGKTQSSQIKSLTDQLIQSKKMLPKPGGLSTQSASIAEKEVNSMVGIATRRKTELLKEIETDPKAFIRDAILAESRKDFPTEVQPFIEENAILNGNIKLLHIDMLDQKRSITEYLYSSDINNLSSYTTKIYFTDQPQVTSGSTISGNGIKIGDNVAVDNSGNVNITNTEQATYTDVVLGVFLVNFIDDVSQPFTATEVREKVFVGSDSVKNFYSDNSYGKLNITGEVHGWYTLPYSYSDCYYNRWWSGAINGAKKAGVDTSKYTHYMLVFPKNYCYNS